MVAGRKIENGYLQTAEDIRKKIGKIFANTLSIFVGRGRIRARGAWLPSRLGGALIRFYGQLTVEITERVLS
jgi:hypothetical protein